MLRWPFAWPEENDLKSYWILPQVREGSLKEAGSNRKEDTGWRDEGREGALSNSATTCRLISPYIDVKMQESIRSVTQVLKLT